MAAKSYLFYQTEQRKPLFARAAGIYIWDVDGKRYIDGSSGPMVSNIGHGNPHVIAAMKQQLDQGPFAYRLHFENEPAERLGQRIAELAIGDLSHSFFVSGGSESVESAIKLARQYAIAIGREQRWKVIGRSPAYHGTTFGALAVTDYEPLVQPFVPMLRQMPKIAAPTCYLDRDNLSMAERGLRYANLLEQEIEKQGPDTVLAFIMEPVGGASTGALVAPDSYYPRIREICDNYNVLLIFDEVMSGAGRTGAFLAAEHWQVAPDIVAMSKGFGAGYCPFGVTIAPQRLIKPILETGGFQHGFTYAGNPLACATALAVLDELQRLNLFQQAQVNGEYLMHGLRELQARFPFIGDVRGKGLLTAFELVQDTDTMQPFPADMNVHQRIVDLAYQRGLIVYSRRSRGGNSGDHVLVCPPLITTQSQLAEIISLLDDSLTAFALSAGLAISA